MKILNFFKQWSAPDADVFLPGVVLKSLGFWLRGKRILADHRSIIRGLKNIDTTKGKLTIGRTGGIFHGQDRSFLNISGKLIIKGNVYLGKGCRVIVDQNGTCMLEDCHFTGGAKIICSKSIAISSDCVIAWDTEFLDWDSHQIQYEGKIEKSPEIHLGKRVWVGSGVRVLKGVSIGEGSVVGAGSVVTKSFPEQCLIGGHPAKIIKTDIRWQNFET